MSPCVCQVKTDLLGLLLLSQASTLAGRGDLENAQTTVTVEISNIASQATIVISDTAVQHNTCPVLPGFQARAEVRLNRSSGRRRAVLRSAPYRAGTVQCAAVRQIKPNHESCDSAFHITWATKKKNRTSYMQYSRVSHLQYNVTPLHVSVLGKLML